MKRSIFFAALLALCFVLSSKQADARHRGNCCMCYCPASVCYAPCIMDGSYLAQTREIWYRYDASEYYSGAWHPAGYFQNPSYELVANSRAGWLAGGSNRWASNIYAVNVSSEAYSLGASIAPSSPSARITARFGTDEAAKARGVFTVNVNNRSSYAVQYGTVTCNNGSGGYQQLQFGYIPAGGTASQSVPFTPTLMGVYFKDGPGPDWGPGTINNNDPNLQYVNLDLYNQK